MRKAIVNISFLLFLLSTLVVAQQVPEGFNYQSIARDALGLPISNSAVRLRITIKKQTANGADVYQETQTATTNQFGLINLVIGKGVSTNISSVTGFSAIDWTASRHFIAVEVDNSGTFTSLGVTEFQSVPYARASENTMKIQGIPVSSTVPVNGQFLSYNNILGVWQPRNISGANGGTMVSISGFGPISITGNSSLNPSIGIVPSSATQDGYISATDWATFNSKLSTSTGFGGNIAGTFDAITVTGIQGISISGILPTSGQTLIYNGTVWIPTTSGISYNAFSQTVGGNAFAVDNLEIRGTTTAGIAKLKVKGDLSAGGQVIASATIQPTGTANTNGAGSVLCKQRIYIPQGTTNLSASVNAYEFIASGGSTVLIYISGILKGTVILPTINDETTSVDISNIDVSTLRGTFQTLEIRGSANNTSQGVIVQGFILKIND